MSVSQLIMVIRSRWRVAFGVFLGVVVLSILLTFVMTKQYTAVASVVIDTKTDPVSLSGAADGSLASYVITETDVIASERVAQRAVKAIKLQESPDLQKAWLSKTGGEGDITIWIADYLLDSKVVVGPGKTKNGNIIFISVKWPDAKVAADIANAFAQAAIETNIDLKIEPAKQFAKWFDLHSVALRASLVAKQKKLSDFENETGITATDEKLDVENARLTELSSELVTMQSLRQDSQSRQRQVSGDNESLPEVLQSPVIGKLKSDLSDAEARQADIAGRLGKNHPDYQAAVSEVSNLQSRIQQESTKIANALGSNTQINVRKENDIRQALEQQKKRVLELKHKHDEAAVLDSDVATAQRDLDAVTQRYAVSSLESQEQQTNLVQLTTAVAPFKESSPKLFLNVLGGLVLGTILGIAVVLVKEHNDPRVRDHSELTALLGVPLLAKMTSVKVKKRRGDGPGDLTRQLEPTAI